MPSDIPEEWERIIQQTPDEPRKRNASGIYQGRDGLRERRRTPDLGWWRDKTQDAQDLCHLRFEPLKYVVPHLIPEGVVLLAGRPKLGKSWLTLQIAGAVAKGEITLVAGNGELPPHGNVLYLALEDGQKRMQSRLTKHYGTLGWPPRGQLTIAYEWLPLGEGGLDGLGEWCLEVAQPRLIVIDILELVRTPKTIGQTDYQADIAAARPLAKLAREFPGLSIICNHHDRKQDSDDPFDTIGGTLGLQGGVDTLALLKRTAASVILYVKGRDLEEEHEKAVNFDRETCRWHILGEAQQVHQTTTRRAVLELLAACGTLTPRQLADQVEDMSYANAKQVLWRMARDGVLDGDRGLYRLHPQGSVTAVTAPVSPDEDFD